MASLSRPHLEEATPSLHHVYGSRDINGDVAISGCWAISKGLLPSLHPQQSGQLLRL